MSSQQPSKPVPFGRLVLEAGLATREQVAECLEVVREAREKGEPVSLGQVLLQRGILTRQEILRILQSQNKTLMQCEKCGRRYNIVGYREGASYRCRYDDANLMLKVSDVDMSDELKPIDDEQLRKAAADANATATTIGESAQASASATGAAASATSSQSGTSFRIETGYVEGVKDLEPSAEEAEAARAASEAAHSHTEGDDTGAQPTADPQALVQWAGHLPMEHDERVIGRIGDFVLTRVLGRGGMGDVYLGRNRMIDGRFAIKILSAEKAKNEQYRERFLREARLANRLDHPNVVKVWDVGAIEGYFFIVMEFIDGETLSELVQRQGQLPVPEAVSIAIQALRGIEAAHQAGIIHRDLKPANILIRRDGLVKVFDFGLALPVDPNTKKLTLQGQTFGTPHFMSPEQIYNRPVDTRTDLYSLGATLYHSLAANYPYPGEKALEVLVKRMNERPLPLTHHRADLPKGLVEVTKQMMADDPDKRFANAYEARKALEEWAVAR